MCADLVCSERRFSVFHFFTHRSIAMNNTLHTSRRARRAFSARTTLAAALVALACAGCVDMPLLSGGSVKMRPTSSAAAARAINGEIDAAKALAFLYNNKVHMFKPGEERIFGERCTAFTQWKERQRYGEFICSAFDAKFTAGGVEKYMIVTETKYTGEAPGKMCSETAVFPVIGAAVFAKEGGQWKLEVENKKIEHLSQWCATGIGDRLLRVGLESYGVTTTSVSTGAGAESESINIIMPYGGTIDEFSVYATEIGWCGGCGGGEDLSLTFDESSGGEYYDAIAHYTEVTLDRNGEVARKRKKNQRLRFVSGEYKEVANKAAGAKKRK